jgi:hypothetical protein
MSARQNLIPNPKAALDVAGWSYGGAGVTSVSLAAEGIVGQPDGLLTAFKYDRFIPGQAPLTSAAITVLPGVVYAARVTRYFSTVPVSAGHFLATFYSDAGCTNLVGSYSVYTFAPYASGWHTYELGVLAPPGSVAAKLQVDSASSTYMAYYTGFQFEPATAILPYADGDSPAWTWSGAANESASAQVQGTGMVGIEEVLAEVIAKLQAGLPAKIASLNAEYDDAYTITAPSNASYLTTFDKPTALQLAGQGGGYPAVIVEPQPETVEGEPDLSDGYDITHAVQVAFVVRQGTPAVQQKQLMRYMRAAKEVLGPQAALACGSCRYEGGGFAAQYSLGKNDILRDIVLLFHVRTLQRAA